MAFRCGHSLTVDVSRIIAIGATLRCPSCGKSTKVTAHRQG